MKNKDYAIHNLRVIRENIFAFATFAPDDPYGEKQEKVEAAQKAVDELIETIEEYGA